MRFTMTHALALLIGAAAGAALAFAAPLSAQDEPAGEDPFAILQRAPGEAALTPPRALAVIPERHTGRPIRINDVLVAIDPQFTDLARGAGLTGRRAIQLRTRETHVPIFVAKTPTTISTLLQIQLGTAVEVRGVLIERGGSYLFLASEVRATAAPARRPR
jgi:hypothetical protein